MKKFQYPFWNKTCPDCHAYTVEDFWREAHDRHIKRSGCYCPNCKKLTTFKMSENQKVWIARISYILNSQEYAFVREMEDSELFKIHGVSASWFYVGRKIYIDPADTCVLDIHTIPKEILSRDDLVLVYMLNNYLQRLYFFVPSNAITPKTPPL